MSRFCPAIALTITFLASTFSACVPYSRYEAAALSMEKYRSLALSLRDSIEEMRWTHLETYRENEALSHRTQLLDTELASTRTQYAQLQVANTDVVGRYDRSLALATLENEAHFSTRRRLTDATRTREVKARALQRLNEEIGEAVEGLENDLEDYRDELYATRSDLDQTRQELRRLGHTPSEYTTTTLPNVVEGQTRRIEPSDELIRRLLNVRELSGLLAFGGGLTSVADEGHQYTVRASETLCFRGRRPILTPAGEAFVRELSKILYGRDRLQVLIHCASKREGTAAQVVHFEDVQGEAIYRALIRQGIHPGNVRVLDEAQWANRVTGSGQLKSRLDGEIIFAIRARVGDGMSMR